MNVHFDSRLRDAAPLRCFSYALSVEFYSLDGTSHVFRQPLHESPDVVCALGTHIVVMRHDRIGLLDRYIGNRRAAPAQEIDQLVARDRVHPRRQRFRRIVGMSLDVDGQHRFLHQIFRLFCAPPNSRELALVIGTQTTAQSFEQRAVRGRVAVQAGKHQCLEFGFVGRHACVSLLVRWSGRFGYRGRRAA